MATKTKDKNDKVRVADNGYRLPEQLPVGEILTDFLKSKWILGKAIACGGFGEIYLVRPLETKIKKPNDYDYVIKVDHFDGPLFCEMNFYVRAAKREIINKWMIEKNLKFLGIPPFIASGLHFPNSIKISRYSKNKKETKYRFLVMPRFGSDLQKVLNNNNLKLSLKTSYTIGIKILDILEYIHAQGYIHADIKASNLLLSAKIKNVETDLHNEIWLVDFGLVERFLIKDNKVHKPYEEDIRRANNGTIEFTSRDGHIGFFSRRSDIEILAYNLLSWLSGGRLPWMSNLKDKASVKNMKNYYMDKLDELFSYAFQVPFETKAEFKKLNKSSKKLQINSSLIPNGIVEFFEHVNKLKFDEKPNYKLLKNILEKALLDKGENFNGFFTLIDNSSSNGNAQSRNSSKRKRSRIVNDKNGFNSSLESDKTDLNNSSDSLNQSIIIEDGFELNNDLVSKKLRKSTKKSNKDSRNFLIKNSNDSNSYEQEINGSSSKNNDLLPSLNGNVNKFAKEIVNSDEIDMEILSNSDKTVKRRNPSRLVKRLQPMNENSITNKDRLLGLKTNSSITSSLKTNGIKSNGLKTNSLKTGKNNSSKISLKESTDNKFKTILKELDNPTPAMKELLNRLKNKKK